MLPLLLTFRMLTFPPVVNRNYLTSIDNASVSLISSITT
ncbi:hypothetical protein CAter10_4838 [Collimonas arenae]|nr:hypothetical protein CAter10_4838 [Collimonas arenae]